MLFDCWCAAQRDQRGGRDWTQEDYETVMRNESPGSPHIGILAFKVPLPLPSPPPKLLPPLPLVRTSPAARLSLPTLHPCVAGTVPSAAGRPRPSSCFVSHAYRVRFEERSLLIG